MLWHHTMGGELAAADWWDVLRHSFVMDASMAGYLTILPWLLILVSVWLSGRWLLAVLKGYFAVTALLVAFIFATHVGLYGFWEFPLDATALFYMQTSMKDALGVVPLGLAAALTPLALAYAIGIYLLFRKLVKRLAPTQAVGHLGITVSILLLGGLMVIPIRGKIIGSPMRIGMTYYSPHIFLNHATVNPCFSLMYSLKKQQQFAKQFHFFSEAEREAVFATLVPPKAKKDSTEHISLLSKPHPNILLVLLESFSANAIEAVGGDAGVTPHLNHLAGEGVLFTNMYANSFRTDRGIVAVLNGYPAQPTTSIMRYPAKNQSLPSLAKTLIAEGYGAEALYGGDITFANAQSYFYGSGYTIVTSDKDFNSSLRLNKLGANDDVTFAYLHEKLRQQSDTASPLFLTFLTLSSHEPFEVPHHRLAHPYLNSVAFTDSCIGDFINRTKQLPVWDNLLIIFVSDHGYAYPDGVHNSPLRYHIPMLWLGGAIRHPAVVDVIANQTDIAATLLTQLSLPCREFIFSKDIFNPSHPHYAFYTYMNGFGVVDSTGFSVYDNEKNAAVDSSAISDTSAISFASHEVRIRNGKALLQTLYHDLGNR